MSEQEIVNQAIAMTLGDLPEPRGDYEEHDRFDFMLL